MGVAEAKDVKEANRMEMFLLTSKFSDFDRLDEFLKTACSEPTGSQVMGESFCKYFDICSSMGSDSEDETTRIDTDDVLDLLAGMASQHQVHASIAGYMVNTEQCLGSTEPCQGSSLLLDRLAQQREAMQCVHEAKLGHTAVSSVGERGTMDRLCKLGLLTILESASFGDHVYIRCFNGIHYASTTPVVRVKEIDEDVVTICDESANPALDRGGRVFFWKSR